MRTFAGWTGRMRVRRAASRVWDSLWFVPAVYVLVALGLSVGLVRWDRARARASQLHLGSVPGFGLPAGFGLGHGFSLDPGRVFTAGVPFGSLRGDALCGPLCPGQQLVKACCPVVWHVIRA